MKKNVNNTVNNAANNNNAKANNGRKTRKGAKAQNTAAENTTPETENAGATETAENSANVTAVIDNTNTNTDTEKKTKSVTEKVGAIVGLVKRELLTNRSVIATLYDNRNDETLSEIAGVLFCDTTQDTTRKVAITAGLKRYIKLMPYVLTIEHAESGNKDYKCAKLESVANGVYKAVESDAIETLTATLTNYYNGGGSKFVEFGKYYDIEGNIIDNTTAKEQIEAEKAAKRVKREESTAKRDEKALNNADVLTLLTVAYNKALSDNNTALYTAIENAIRAI